MVKLSKFQKFNDSDDVKTKAEKIIYFMENEGGFKRFLINGKLDNSKRQYILEKQQGMH